MDLIKLYDVIKKENIDIDNIKWTNTKARIFEIDNNYSIAIDYSQIENSIEERQILAEELGHYYCNALYCLNDNKLLKDKCEHKALKWAYSILVPYEKLKEKITQGLDLYDLADYFNVDCKYMNDCILFYLSIYGNFSIND